MIFEPPATLRHQTWPDLHNTGSWEGLYKRKIHTNPCLGHKYPRNLIKMSRFDMPLPPTWLSTGDRLPESSRFFNFTTSNQSGIFSKLYEYIFCNKLTLISARNWFKIRDFRRFCVTLGPWFPVKFVFAMNSSPLSIQRTISLNAFFLWIFNKEAHRKPLEIENLDVFLVYCEETESKSAQNTPGGPSKVWTGSQIDFCLESYLLRIQGISPKEGYDQ